MTECTGSDPGSRSRSGSGECRAMSLYCWLQACAAAAFMLCAWNDARVGWALFLTFQVGATIGLDRRQAWHRHPSVGRVSIAIALGFFVTWLAMHLTVARYDEASDETKDLWQFQHGDRKTGREEEVRVAPVVAGFPLWGVGGTDGYRADRWVARIDLPPVPRPEFIGGSFWSPLHMKLERGLGLLWGNWVILTLVCFLVAAALPDRVLVRARWLTAALGLLGFMLGVGWQSEHGYNW